MKKIYSFLCLIVVLGAFLRFYSVDTNPPGLYIDEIANGYNAHLIRTTGVDEHDKSFPLWFESFGDYKPPVYIYLTVISLTLFGNTDFAVRFPSVLSGILSILLIYFLLYEIVRKSKTKFHGITHEYLSLLAALLLAISPWHISFSRGGFEVTLGLFFYLLGLLSALLFLRKKKIFWLVAGFSVLILSIYTYHSFRVLVPLTVIAITCYLFLHKQTENKRVIISVFYFLLLLIPVVLFTFTPEGSARFHQTSTFSDYTATTVLQKLFLYPLIIFKNFINHFSLPFLFSYGDRIGRHQMPGFGLLPLWQFPFLLAGFYSLVKWRHELISKVIMGLLIITPLASSLAKPSPHSLRSLPLVIPLLIIITFGIITLMPYLARFKKIPILLLSGYIIYESISFFHAYSVHYPKVNVIDWGGGNKEIVMETIKLKSQYDVIVTESSLGELPMYFTFYTNSITPVVVSNSWVKPADWKGKKVLLIRTFYGNENPEGLVKNIRLLNAGHDIYAQLIRL